MRRVDDYAAATLMFAQVFVYMGYAAYWEFAMHGAVGPVTGKLAFASPVVMSMDRCVEVSVVRWAQVAGSSVADEGLAEHLKDLWRTGELLASDFHEPLGTTTVLESPAHQAISGRGLPSFPGTHGDCSTDLKITPQRSFRRKLFRQLAEKGLPVPVTCLGTRYVESARRAGAMRSRGESDQVAMTIKDGDLVLSPISRWSDDDVWEAVGLYGGGALPGFSDFEDMRRIYAHSVGTGCAVVADAILEGVARKQGKCGARLGCHVCQMAEDKSLANMIEFDERYAYARGLQRLNRFIRCGETIKSDKFD